VNPCQIIQGDCLDVMRTMADGSVDAVVTDPPYGLAFMGKAWDHGVPGVAFWTEAARVAKPGAHLLAFGGTRTYHRLACAIEDAGWEIRDCLSWLYGSGFPKSHNGAWGGTALKPAWEPVIMARKPLIGTVAANHAAHGTGALNIDGCRIGTDAGWEYPNGRGGEGWHGRESLSTDLTIPKKAEAGRWPANVALDEDAAAALDEQSGDAGGGTGQPIDAGDFGKHGRYGKASGAVTASYADFGGASRFFYTAKASRSEREAGLDGMPAKRVIHQAQTLNNGSGGLRNGDGLPTPTRNIHPTVKPVDLMRWLVRLVTPMGGTVLDPFLGSGTTLVAAIEEGCMGIGIEREPAYVEIARARVKHAAAQGNLFGATS
jgi:DNA modification methylase